jgi:hypothetical protein
MNRRTLLILLLVGFSADGLLAASSPRLVLAPVKRRVRDAEAAVAIETALRFQLTEFGELTSSLETRDELRRLRLRDVDTAAPEVIAGLASALGANWIVVATIHDVRRLDVSDLAMSVRFYRGDTGELAWADFMGRNGLDGRKALGLGVLTSMEDLARELVRRLLKESMLALESRRLPSNQATSVSASGRLALVPFTGFVEQDALGVADAATEATRAVLFRRGIDVATPGCVAEALRLQRAQVWGELAAETRNYLRETCGADRLLTGSVGHWETRGSALEPVPEIALAVRLLEATSGKIVWMSSIEKTGRSSESLFRAGRIYSRGKLLDRLLSRLADEMVEEGALSSS